MCSPVTGYWRTDWYKTSGGHFVQHRCDAGVFWIIILPLSDSRHTTGEPVRSEVSLAACWARTGITPGCLSDQVSQKPRLNLCESVSRTPISGWILRCTLQVSPPAAHCLPGPGPHSTSHPSSPQTYRWISYRLHLSADISLAFHARDILHLF